GRLDLLLQRFAPAGGVFQLRHQHCPHLAGVLDVLAVRLADRDRPLRRFVDYLLIRTRVGVAYLRAYQLHANLLLHACSEVALETIALGPLANGTFADVVPLGDLAPRQHTGAVLTLDGFP